MAEQTLREKTAKGLFWGGISNGVQQVLALGFGIFLSRILSPGDYGMVGLLTVSSSMKTVAYHWVAYKVLIINLLLFHR